jgi:hypothetical protein
MPPVAVVQFFLWMDGERFAVWFIRRSKTDMYKKLCSPWCLVGAIPSSIIVVGFFFFCSLYFQSWSVFASGKCLLCTQIIHSYQKILLTLHWIIIEDHIVFFVLQFNICVLFLLSSCFVVWVFAVHWKSKIPSYFAFRTFMMFLTRLDVPM